MLAQFRGLPPDQAKVESWLFRTTFIQRLTDVFGTEFCNVQHGSTSMDLFLSELPQESCTGILQTRNQKRASISYSLILRGTFVACIYVFGNDQLEEPLSLCSKAVQRDLMHESTCITFARVDQDLIQSSTALLQGNSKYHTKGLCLYTTIASGDVIRNQFQKNSAGVIVVNNNNALYYIFISSQKLLAVLAVLYVEGGVKLQFSRDDHLLAPELNFNVQTKLDVFEVGL